MSSDESASDRSGQSTPSDRYPIQDTPLTGYASSPAPGCKADYFSNLHSAVATRLHATRHPAIKNICCIGAGYVGGPTAAIIALKNPNIIVNVADLDTSRIRKWNSKHLPVHEPGLIDVVRIARDGTKRSAVSHTRERQPNLFFTTDVQGSVGQADIIFLSVNTPTKISGIGAGSATNLVALESAVGSVALWAKSGAIIVEKSTVPCRTAQMVRDILNTHRPGVPFEVLSNPEFLAEGTAVKNLLNPDRILIGSMPTLEGLAAAAALKSVYAAWIDKSRILTVKLWSSELAKLVANAMLAQRISSINSVSAVCEATGADINEIAYTVGQDSRIGSKFLQAGLGFGGSCFKKDILNLVYMANTLDLPEVAEYWMQVIRMNDYQRNRFVRTVVKKMNSSLIGKKIAVFGWTFKEDTNDSRESPAIEVVKELLRESPKELVIYDPGCNPSCIIEEIQQIVATPGLNLVHPDGPIRVVSSAFEACQEANAVLLLTPWNQFRYPARSQEPHDIHDHRAGPDAINDLSGDVTTELGTLAAGCDDQLAEELPCEDDCQDCLHDHSHRGFSSTQVPWRSIAKVMKKPSLVFDARGLVDASAMEKLGFKVEVIGKVSSRSPLYGYINL